MKAKLVQVVAAVGLLAAAAPSVAAPPPPPPLIGSTVVNGPAGCRSVDRFETLNAAVDRSAQTGAPQVNVAVYCHGRLLYQRAAGRALEEIPGVDAFAIFRVASTTKPVTAAMVLKLEAEGLLKLDDPLSKYLPEFPGAGGITLYQLLTHTAGIADFTEDASYPAHKTRPHSTAEMVAWIASLQPATRFAPGAGWAYSNSGYVLLGAVIEKVTGQSLDEAYRQRLFEPLRLGPAAMGTTALNLRGADGQVRPMIEMTGHGKAVGGGPGPAEPIDMSLPGAAGGLRTSARDLAALMDAILSGRALPGDSLKRMTAPGLLADGRTDRWGMPVEWREGLQADYGLGLFIDDKGGRRRWWHSGDIDGFHSFVVHYPTEALTIVILRNSDYGDPMEDEIQAAVLKTLAL